MCLIFVQLRKTNDKSEESILIVKGHRSSHRTFPKQVSSLHFCHELPTAAEPTMMLFVDHTGLAMPSMAASLLFLHGKPDL